jgi:hypothetical protein
MNSKNSYQISKELQELIEIHGISLFLYFLKIFNCSYIDKHRYKLNDFYKMIVNVYYRDEESGHRIFIITNDGTRISMFESSVQEITRDFKRFSSLKAFI